MGKHATRNRTSSDGQPESRCRTCSEWKAHDHFHPSSLACSRYICKPCIIAAVSAKQKDRFQCQYHRLACSLRARERRYKMPCGGINPAMVQNIFESFNHRCALTGRAGKLTIVRRNLDEPLSEDNALLVAASGVRVRDMSFAKAVN